MRERRSIKTNAGWQYNNILFYIYNDKRFEDDHISLSILQIKNISAATLIYFWLRSWGWPDI